MTPATLSKFIVDERPLLVFRSLVRELGLPEAVFLQQLHYWLFTKSQSPERYADHFIQDRFWVHWNYEEMRAEIPLGTSTCDTHKRVVCVLKGLGVLHVAHHGPRWDRTNWYSIDYKKLDALLRKSPGNPSNGGEAADASAAAPPMPPRPGRPSIGGKSTGHYLLSFT